jgi:LmbE family N-acetylglucosaminyl deacetylase
MIMHGQAEETGSGTATTGLSAPRGLSRRRALLTLGAVPAAGLTAAGPAAWAAAPAAASGNRIMNIVAHEDDDLLFLSPDLLHDIQAGRTVRTVFITAGDAADQIAGGADQQRKYWMAREEGNRAAYALMAGVPNSWKQSTVAVNGHQLAMFTLAGKPNITEIFLRLPDGNPDGSGATVHHHQSLLKLRANQIPAIDTVDGSSSYTKASLLATVTALIEDFAPDVIRTQDYAAGDFQPIGDHADHTCAAYLAHAASDAYSQPHQFIGYLDYQISDYPSNVTGADYAAKQAAFYLYDSYDSLLMCYTPQLRAKNHQCDAYVLWLSRQYRVVTGPGWDEPCLVPDLSTDSTLFGGEPPSLDEALAQIRAQGGWPGPISYAYDPDFPDQFVISQTPEPSPKFLPQGSQVSITVSKGPKPETPVVIVPNTIGESQADAFRLIQYAGLKPAGPAPVKGKVRIVTAQTPKAGTEVKKGTTVRLTSKVV